MNYRITGKVKGNFHKNEWELDLTVTETQPEQAKPEAPKAEPTTYTVEYQGRTSGLWRQSYNEGIVNPYTDFAKAQEALLDYRSKRLNYRILTSDGIAVYFDAVPEVTEEPTEYTVQDKYRGGWGQSINYGLQETFPTIGEAEVAISLHKSVGMNYRIVDNNGVVVDLPYLTTPKPEVKPSTFIIEVWHVDGWSRSRNKGLTDTYTTQTEAEQALEAGSRAEGYDYRVTEVKQ